MNEPVAAESSRRSPVLQVVRRFFPATMRARARVAIFRWLDLNWTTASGVHLRLDDYGEWLVHQEIFVDGEYDWAIELALAGAPSDRPLRVLDLGANHGFFTLRVLDRVRHFRGSEARVAVTAIEPRADTAAAFRRHVFDDNGLRSSVVLVEGLAGRRSGSARLKHGVDHGSSSIFRAYSGASTEAAFVDLVTLLAHESTIDLIKCDIEGAELMLIEDQTEVFKKTRVVVFELHDALCDTTRCRELLAQIGFQEQPGLRSRDGFSLYLGLRHD